MNSINKLRQKLDKVYWKGNSQCLYLRTVSDWYWKPKCRCIYDIVITDKAGKECGDYLFEIRNLMAFRDLELTADWSKLRTFNRDFYETLDLKDVAHIPFYMDGIFTLKTFKNITQEDIHNCANYLVEKVLNMWLFNIKVVIPPRIKNKND
ncbi:hypothetical protein LCGC14_0305600 [marine sediment metagenome]|uniref:Uncharacterized protein n=1 Tax=marine sediment metagenome TaxID=412755 RepID=A0A0F9WAH1_9ZZZZ